MYSTADAVEPVAVETTVEKYSIEQGQQPHSEIRAFPYLDVGGRRWMKAEASWPLFCVNRHLQRDTAAPSTWLALTRDGNARVLTLSGASIYQPNDEMPAPGRPPGGRAS